MVVIPVTIKGANYLHWTRLAKTALGGRRLWEIVEEGRPQKKIILGEDGKEVVLADVGAKKKCQEDQLVLSILQHSLDPSLQEGYPYCETSKELWDTLQKVYGNNSNISRVFEVKRVINTLSQEDNNFDKHFEKFRSLWAELEILRPTTIDPDVLNQRREKDKVFALLLTLHPSYGDLIKHILSNNELPSQDEVCSEIHKEQGSVGLFGGGKKDLKKNHGKDKCCIHHPHLKPQKFRTGYNDAKTNFSGDIDEPSIQGSMRQTNEAYENKGGAFRSGSALRNTQDETIRRSDIEALIKLLKGNSGDVTIANGERVPIKGVGDLRLFNKDSKAFYMPSFTSNLLSVKRATNDLNCSVTFTSNDVYFQDIETSRLLGNGVTKGDLIPTRILQDQSPYQENKEISWRIEAPGQCLLAILLTKRATNALFQRLGES
ncbi:uncharacterized protein LOC125596540 [Brassica napus]|uniref:uncharacterized protein LOC125596540 n=1 Tax=Brassica napus TaxID=3708 RepID=UPI002078AF11|nr:uncharacterized protein LOC125596540 [Brassica napus]